MKFLFEIDVRNQRTGEMVTVTSTAYGPQDAQVDALIHVFRNFGWNSALAIVARERVS